MLDDLINLVKQQAGDAIVNNPAIPNDKNDLAVQEAGSSILGGLQNAISGGGLKDVLKLFGGQGNDIASNPVTQQVSGNVVQNLMQKFNLDQGAASNIAGSLVPNVLQKLVNKTNDPSDSSFDIQGIFNNLTNGKTSGMNIQGLLSKVAGSGLDRDGDGDVDLQDAMAMLSGGQGAGGLMDKVKGFFGG